MHTFWILVLCVALSFCASSAQGAHATEADPVQIEVQKSDATFAAHFERIVAQVTRADIQPAWVFAHKAGTLKDAITLIRERTEFKNILYVVEKDGWFLFSTAFPAKDVKVTKGTELSMAFHSGFAIKKDSEKVYSFGFW